MDRMLGPLVRYLRFMGYDTLAATELGPGGPREDSGLLRLAAHEGRILLTRDRELAGRGGVLVSGDDVLEQVAALARCRSRRARAQARPLLVLQHPPPPGRTGRARGGPVSPRRPGGRVFYRCDACGRIYWAGSHADRLAERLDRINRTTE